ncbi:MAG TPA: hypothetical protein VD907_06440 [Verrucomicrobiae bacterium]|nr:hypothetical protein [Verrucomicrobiae bacterium]
MAQIDKHSLKRSLITHRRKTTVISLLFLIILIIMIYIISQPERSVANFCKVAVENKSSLQSGANHEESLSAYSKLEAVSPDDIRPDITTIRKGYEIILDDPSKTLETGFGTISSEGRRTDYINKNCPDF